MNNEQLNNLNCSLLGLAASAKALAQLASECMAESKPVAPRQVVLQWCEKNMHGKPWGQTPEGCTLPHGWSWGWTMNTPGFLLSTSDGATVSFHEANEYCGRAAPVKVTDKPTWAQPPKAPMSIRKAIAYMLTTPSTIAWGNMPAHMLPSGWKWKWTIDGLGEPQMVLVAYDNTSSPTQTLILRQCDLGHPVKPTRCMSRGNVLIMLANMDNWDPVALPAGWQRRTVRGNVYVVCVAHKEYITYNDWVVAREPSLLWG